MPFKLRNLAAGDIPKHLTTLSVSWLNNQLKAVAIHHGQVAASWERPESKDAPDNFEALIHDAIRETGYQGQTLSLALAHPRLVQQMVDVPPVKGPALNRIIQHQAAQQKLFSGEAAYASQMLVSTKGSRRVLLHLFPRTVLNQFMLACRRNNLHLVSVVPVSATLQRQLPALSPQKGDILMLAAETAGSTTVVICDGDGRLFLARTLQGTWNEDAPKLALDLNRTILYVHQHFNVNVNRGLFLFGAGATEQAPLIQKSVQIPVKVSPVPCDPVYWATETLKLRPETTPNFQSPELQKAPQRRVFATVVGGAAAILLAGSIAVTSYSVVQGRRELAAINSFSGQIARIEARQRTLDQLDSELQRKQQAIQLVLGDRPPPKPAWLLAYLGQVVPADLVITNLTVKREADYYRVKLAGTHHQASVTPAGPSIAESVETFKSTLSGSPFHMRILETDAAGKIVASAQEQSKPAAARGSLPDWLEKATKAITGKVEPKPQAKEIDRFVIEGVVR